MSISFGSINNNVKIGSSGSTTTINGPLTLSTPITPSYLPSVITATQIGFVKEGTYAANFAVVGSTTKLVSTLSLTAGVWIVTSVVSSFVMNGTILYLVNSINELNNSIAIATAYGQMSINVPSGVSANPEVTTTAIISLSATTNIFNTVQTGTNGTLAKVKMLAVRIA